MKKIIYLALAAFVCSCSNGGFKLTGTVDGVSAGDSVSLYVYNEHEPVAVAESKVGEDGVINLKGDVVNPEIAILILNGTHSVGAVILESGDITVAKSDFGGIEFSGTPLNDANVEFVAARAALDQKFEAMPEDERAAGSEAIYAEYLELVDATVDNNLDNVFGALVFVTCEFAELDAPAAAARMAEFAPEIAENGFMSETASSIEAMLKVEVGQPYTDIKLNDVNGKEVAVSELLSQGKYVLIDFWATWCAPCISEMPHLKDAYAAYKSKGFEIYGVSLDTDANAWSNMVKGGMPWINVNATTGSTAAVDYVVRSIPTNYLISPEGKIVAKNLRGEQVAETLAEYIK